MLSSAAKLVARHSHVMVALRKESARSVVSCSMLDVNDLGAEVGVPSERVVVSSQMVAVRKHRFQFRILVCLCPFVVKIGKETVKFW